MRFTFWTFVVFSSVIAVFCQRLPDGVTPCTENDPQRNDCIQEQLQRLLPLMRNGGGSTGFGSIDPIPFDGLPFEYNTAQTKLTFTLKKGTCYGFGDTQIKKVRSQITADEWKFHIDIMVPRVFIEAKYRGHGAINGMALGSKGDFNVTATGLTGTLKIRAKKESSNGEDYIRVNHIDLVPKVKTLRTYIEGLVPDPELNRIALEFVNEYIAQNRNDLLKETRKFFDPLLTSVANSVTLRIPARYLLL
ncbi:uncharacterized protein LOC132264595 [Phlebotomus argentipes]|uniref:uncharacterized protein LOC132264595 n=1 Tax=Phlebotomus argentipes TaxID=94469 RepID=UPI002892E31C|nr:uncharacterized protein LOC132264595 [Phlebotomus argentipes]